MTQELTELILSEATTKAGPELSLKKCLERKFLASIKVNFLSLK
jgi:hypothetical protein